MDESNLWKLFDKSFQWENDSVIMTSNSSQIASPFLWVLSIEELFLVFISLKKFNFFSNEEREEKFTSN